MYPARFEFDVPGSLEEALAILNERGDEARVLAGGQSLIPMMKLRFAMPAALVDINRLPGLDRIDHVDGQLRLGALVRHNAVAESDLVRRHNHVMAAAAPWIADPLVRNLGTIGGSLAHADPEGDWASVMLACRAEVVARLAGDVGPCSAWASRSAATMAASAVSSAITATSEGPASTSIPTRQ